MVERIDQLLAVAAAEVLPDQVSKELRTRMRGLPVMIHTSGLAATCAFLLARAKQDEASPYYLTAKAILSAAAGAARVPEGATPHATLTALASASGHRYLLAETRARELALWLSRLAQARYQPPPGGDREEPA